MTHLRVLFVILGGLRCGIAKTFMVLLFIPAYVWDAIDEGWNRALHMTRLAHYEFHQYHKSDEEREDEERQQREQQSAYENFVNQLTKQAEKQTTKEQE